MTTATTQSKRNLAQPGDGDVFPRPFGNYILLMPFARGGMGEVYLAKRGAILGAEKYCVLKKLRPELTEDREYVARFIDEARVVVQLNHANICQVFDVGRVGSEYYLAMEYISGRDVRSVHDRARGLSLKVNEASVLHLLAETLSALDYAHRRTHPMTGEPLNLVHRDVSPQNVMVSFEGEVKLIDFGLASSRLKVERTQPNIVMGKMAYMAPEQARGDAIDKRADLFAAAVVGYELIVGERFYEGMSSQEIWYVVGRGGFVPQKWEELSPDFARILAKALHPEPDSRYATCADFRDAVMGYLHTRHPGLGERSLRELIADLYAEEILRERDMLLGFAEVSGEVVSDLLENTKSQSISLAAAADLLTPPTTGARVVHDEHTLGGQDSRSSPSPKTQIVETFTESTGSSAEGISEEQTLLEGTQVGEAGAERATTPPTGTIARDLADAIEKTRLGFEPSQGTLLDSGQSADQTARFQRSPFAEVRTLSVSIDEDKGRRRPLLAAAAAALVVTAGVFALMLGDDAAPAPAVAASASGEPQDDDALAAGVEGAADDAEEVAAVEGEAPTAADSAEENGADGAQEPVPPAGAEEPAAGSEAQPAVAAAQGSAEQRRAREQRRAAAEEKARAKERAEALAAAKRAAAEDKARAKEQQREAAKRAADEKARKAREAREAREAKEAKEARRAQARAVRQQPRESVQQMVSVVGKCGLPSPCAKSDMVSGWIKYSSMKPEEKRAFDSNVRSCRKKCSN